MTKESDLTKLRSEKRKLESDLQLLDQATRTTRFQSIFPRPISKTKEEIKEEITKIDQQIKKLSEQKSKPKTLSTQTNTTTSVTFSSPLTSTFVRRETFIVDDSKQVPDPNKTLNTTPHATGTIPKTTMVGTPPPPLNTLLSDDPNDNQSALHQQLQQQQQINISKENRTTLSTTQTDIAARDLEKTVELNKSLSYENEQLRKRLAAEQQIQEEETRRAIHEQALQDCTIKEKNEEIEKLQKAITDSEILLKTKLTYLPSISENNYLDDYYALPKSHTKPPTHSDSQHQDKNIQNLPNRPNQLHQLSKAPPYIPLYRDNERIHIDSRPLEHFDHLETSTPTHENPKKIQSPTFSQKPTNQQTLEDSILYHSARSLENSPSRQQPISQPQTISSLQHDQFTPQTTNLPNYNLNMQGTKQTSTMQTTQSSSHPETTFLPQQTRFSSQPNSFTTPYYSNIYTNQQVHPHLYTQPAPQPETTFKSQRAQRHTSQPQTMFTTQRPHTQGHTTTTIPNYDSHQIPQTSQHIPQFQTTFHRENTQTAQNLEQNTRASAYIPNPNELNEQQLSRLAELIVQRQQRQQDQPTDSRNFERPSRNISKEKPRDSYIRRLRLLPIFNGESYKQLQEFLEIAETLYYAYINNLERTEFMDTMSLQIRGEAREIIGNIYDKNFEEIKNSLSHHFAHLNNKNIVSSQLENLRQETNETISAYADRARKLLREKNMTYSHLTEELRLEHNRLARKHFSQGIANQRLRDRLLIRGSSSLEDAIAYVIEAENDLINTITNNELFCKHCKSNGHRERDCRKKANNQSGINQFINALRNFNPNTSNTYSQNSNRNQNQNTQQYNYNRSNNENWRNNNDRQTNRNSNYNENWRSNNNKNPNDNRTNQYHSNQPSNRNEYSNNRNNSNDFRDTRGNQQSNRNDNQYNRRQQSNINYDQYLDSNDPELNEQNSESQNDSSSEEFSEN